MGCEHGEVSHLRSDSSRRLKIALSVVLVIMVAEVVGGILSNSLALLGDAGHMLVDALAMGMSILAIRIARRPATATRTYGYHRVEIMAALANGVILALVAAYIFYEAYQRFAEPAPVQTTLMLVIAGIGLVSNLVGVRLLRGASHGSLVVKAAFWHVLGDTISSVGVIIAGVIISLTGYYIADPIIAVLIGCIILWGAVRLVRDSADILMEAVPRHIKMEDVISLIRAVRGVKDVHDIHVWTITSGLYAMSAHLVIDDQSVSKSAEIVKAVNQSLDKSFHISHTTLQLECDVCPTGLVCQVGQTEDGK